MKEKIKKISSAFAEIRQALDRITVGYSEFKDALVVAVVKQALGIRGGHVLVFGPTGTAKTHTTKGLAQILTSTGISVPYARVQGDADTMPQDFLKRRKADYDDAGRPVFKWELQTVETFQQKPDQILPGLFQFDELDKIPAKAQHGLLEAMEEQQVTIPKVGAVRLNFTLVATANTRKFDPTAQPLSRAVQDRFGSVVVLGYQNLEADLEMLEHCTSSLTRPEIHLNHFPVEELRWLREYIRKSGLPLHESSQMKQAIVTAVKLTQQRLDGYTDFTRYIKVPAGPRGILDLYWEAGVSALLVGADELTPEFPLKVGVRVLRGRVEVTPEAELEGITNDVLIRKILAEVFGDMPRTSSRKKTETSEISCEINSQDDPDAEADKKEEDSDFEERSQKSGDESDKDDSGADKSGSGKKNDSFADDSDSQVDKEQKDGAKSGTGQDKKQEEKSRAGAGDGASTDWRKEGFLAAFRKEAQKSGPRTDSRADSLQKKDKKGNGGDDGGTGNGGEKSGSTSDGSADSGGSGDSDDGDDSSDRSTDRGDFGDGGSNSSATSGQKEKSSPSGQVPKDGAGIGKEGSPVKTIASREALAQYLAQQAAAEKFKTREGLKTGAEIVQDLASGKQKFDFQSADGKFQAHVRGSKAICQGSPDDIQKFVQQDQDFGEATVGGNLAGKGIDFPSLDVFSLPPHITSVLPMLREMNQQQIVEKLENWVKLEPQNRSRTGVEYRLIKGFVHLAALKAVNMAEEIESSELTPSCSGERVDFVSGPHEHLPLDEERTILEALAQGGIIDDEVEIHQKRVRADAPQILFVLDSSGSMGYENRMMSAAVAAAACAQKYGAQGATFGLIGFSSHPALVVPMPETQIERVKDGIFSLKPGGGTSYARALELAIRHAQPKTTVVVLGDFLDGSLLSQEALALKNSKDLKFIGVVSSHGNPEYARSICDEVYLTSFEDPTSVALVVVKSVVL